MVTRGALCVYGLSKLLFESSRSVRVFQKELSSLVWNLPNISDWFPVVRILCMSPKVSGPQIQFESLQIWFKPFQVFIYLFIVTAKTILSYLFNKKVDIRVCVGCAHMVIILFSFLHSFYGRWTVYSGNESSFKCVHLVILYAFRCFSISKSKAKVAYSEFKPLNRFFWR